MRLYKKVFISLFFLFLASIDFAAACPVQHGTTKGEAFFKDVRNYAKFTTCFDGLPEGLGDITPVKFTDAPGARVLHIPTYKGKPRYGVMPYTSRWFTTGDSFAAGKTAMSNRLLDDALVYNNLVLFDILKQHVTKENFLTNKSGRSQYGKKTTRELQPVPLKTPFIFSYYPRYHLQSLGGGVFTSDYLTRYDPSLTGYIKSRGTRPRTLQLWGGKIGDEFAANKAITTFADNEISKLKHIASQTEKQAFIVQEISLDSAPYDFSKKGFPTIINWTIGDGGTATGLVAQYFPQDKDLVFLDYKNHNQLLPRPDLPGHPEYRLFIPMEEAKAEKLIQEKKKLYLVYSVRFYGVGFGGRKWRGTITADGLHLRAAALYEITNTHAEIYLDDVLNDKLMDISLFPVK